MRILLCVFVALFTAASAEAGKFHVNSEQYQRVLELLQAEGIIPNVTNGCEIDIDNTYLCTAKSSEVTILYRAAKQGDNLTNITIGATAKNIQTAARVAAMACLSLDDEWVTMGTSPKALSILLEQITIIAGIMKKTYVSGGLDFNKSEFCEQFYMNNERGNMTIVRVTAK